MFRKEFRLYRKEICLFQKDRFLFYASPRYLTITSTSFLRKQCRYLLLGILQGSVGQMLSTWKKREYIELVGNELPRNEWNRQQYAKTDKYLKKR